MAVDRHQIENLLYREARLMDEHQYDEWLALWADEMLYWVPCNEDDYDPMEHISIIYDDRNRLETRIERLKSGAVWTQDPPSRMRRLVSNVEIEESESGEITVYSNFNITELRRQKQDTFAGHAIHKLRPENGGFKITYKKVILINNDDPMDAVTFLL